MAKRLRAVLFVGFAFALWAFARPAHAASLAPFCDDRGATAIASPPALEAPGQAVLRAAVRPCDGGHPLVGLAFKPFRATSPEASDAVEQAWRVPAATLASSPAETLDFIARESSPPHGVRCRVERPPRAAATRAT